ncbi:hypothetical protein QTN25_002389 [Entamoeba marina]
MSEENLYALEMDIDDGKEADDYLEKAMQVASETEFLEDDGFYQSTHQTNTETTITEHKETKNQPTTQESTETTFEPEEELPLLEGSFT